MTNLSSSSPLKSTLLTALCMLCFVDLSLAQTKDYPLIHTMENMERLQSADPSIVSRRANIETFINQNIAGITLPIQEVMIGLVFHVLYADASEKISENQIWSQIEALNRDFGSFNSNFQHPALTRDVFLARKGQISFRFCLASEEGGKSINYKATPKDQWTMDDGMKSEDTGGLSPRQPDKYINIWVVDLEEGNTGYAQMPGGALTTDGIVIDYQALGIGGSAVPPFDQGRRMTHLMGNYFNLLPLWGDSLCEDDGVTDTPIHNAPNFGCAGYRHITTCSKSLITEMTMNFMDNTDDACMMMFTQGQRDRIYASIIPGGVRASLLNNPITCTQQPESQDISAESRSQKKEIEIFPNPVENILNISLGVTNRPGIIALEVLNVDQKVMVSKRYDVSLQDQIDVSNWPSGFYFFQFSHNGTLFFSERVVVSHP